MQSKHPNGPDISMTTTPKYVECSACDGTGHEEDLWYEEDRISDIWATYYDTCSHCFGAGFFTEEQVILMKLKGTW